MNKKLRKIKNAVNNYVILLVHYPEIAKENCKEFLLESKILKAMLNDYLDETTDLFQTWCDESVKVFEYDDSNIFKQIKKLINLKIVNHHLNKLSYELSVIEILEENLKIIIERLTQYKYFT